MTQQFKDLPLPAVYKNNSNLFPQQFLTIPKGDYLKYQETEEQKIFFKTLTYEEMNKLFQKDPNFYDLHGHEFQNFCIRETKNLDSKKVKKMTSSRNFVDLRISRGRFFAIATRDDLDWKGNEIKDEKEKKQKAKEVFEYLNSLKLYNHLAKDAEFELPKKSKT